MLRRIRLVLFLLMATPVLMGVGPLQEAESGFELQWWHLVCLLTVLVVGLLWFISMLAGRSTPAVDKEPEKYGTTLSHTSPPPPAPKREPEKPAAAAPPTSAPAKTPPLPPVEPQGEPIMAPPPPPTPKPDPAVGMTPPIDPLPDPESVAITNPVAPEAPQPEDDLAGKLEGIGPGIQGVLYNAGIKTFSQLAKTPAVQLKEILAAAGDRYRLADPTSWPEQAQLAAAGDWVALQQLQDRLKGGRVTS